MTVPIFKQGDIAHIIDILMISSTDHVTPKTGLGAAVTVTLTKNGAAFGAAAGTIAEIGNGHYSLTPTAADTGTLGLLGWHATATGADPSDGLVEIVAFDPFDATRFGLTALPNAAAGTTTGLPVGDPWATAVPAAYGVGTAGNVLGNTSTAAQLATAVWASATRTLTASLDPSAAAIASAVFAFVTETNVTFQGFVRVATSALFGKSTNGGDTFRDFNDTKNRITGTVDALGNRTTMTTDQT